MSFVLGHGLSRAKFHMQPCQFLPGRCEGREIGRKRNPRQLALKIGRVPFPIARMMQQRVEVMEDVFFRDGLVGVVLAKLGDGGRPKSYVKPTLGLSHKGFYTRFQRTRRRGKRGL